MMLILHICIALSSVAYTTYLAISLDKTKFKFAYGLVGATIATGTYLVISTHSPLLQSCEAGLAYLAVASAGIATAYYRLASQNSDN